MLRQHKMIEYVIVAISGAALVTHYMYVLGNLSARIQNSESNIKWIRDFLMSKFTNSRNFTQESTIKVNGDLKNAIPLSWKTILNGANVNVDKCNNAYDCVVCLCENQGPIVLKRKADKLGIEYNDFLLASGIYLYDKRTQKE